jgi:hypothetical protein
VYPIAEGPAVGDGRARADLGEEEPEPGHLEDEAGGCDGQELRDEPSKEILESEPTMMFCGLPLTVATEPMFMAAASASRLGSGRTRYAREASTTNGVSMMAIVSLRKTAESAPDPKTSATRKAKGLAAKRTSLAMTAAKNPLWASCALRTMTPKRNTRVTASSAAQASSKSSRPSATTNAAPVTAMPARFMRTPGRKPRASPA